MKIAFATGTRADWGLLSPLATKLRDEQKAQVVIMATNMHYQPEYGLTYKEIEADGFKIDCHIPTSGTPAEIMSVCILQFAEAFASHRPDCVVILGDRFEMLAVAEAAVLTHIPICHIAGGAVSEGAFDDSFRHAITKMSTLHLCETEQYRQRIIQMGEHPSTVVNTGAIGAYNAMKLPLLSQSELSQSLGFDIDDRTILVTLHAATLETMPPAEQMTNLIESLSQLEGYKILFTHPNNDVDADKMIKQIDEFAAANSKTTFVVPSLGRIRYLSALKYVCAVVGNSSSGLVEVPSMGIPTLDIGLRQQGRTAAASVHHCNADAESVSEGLRLILSEQFRAEARRCENPYYRDNTPELMVNAILKFNWENSRTKHFFDLPQ